MGTDDPPVTIVAGNVQPGGYSYPDSSGLSNGTTYHWAIEAKNTFGLTKSASHSFKTLEPTPILSGPTNGAVGLPLNDSIAWDSTTGVLTYDVYFGTPSTPGRAAAGVSALTWAYSSFPGLDSGTTYCWDVVARNSANDSSIHSEVWTLKTLEHQPGLIAPANNATSVPITGSLAWNPVSGANGYDVYFGENPASLARVVNNLNVTSWSYGTLSADSSYYWYTLARVAGDDTSPHTPTWTFTAIDRPSVTSVSPDSGQQGRPWRAWLSAGRTSRIPPPRASAPASRSSRSRSSATQR